MLHKSSRNQTQVHRHSFRGILTASTEDLYHSYLLRHAFDRYQSLVGESDLGSALALCANYRDAEIKDYPFSKVLLTGIGDRENEVREASAGDDRVSYQQENAEKLPFSSNSFDVVFCKEGLHHLVRPVLGLYEMLRVARQGVILVEPFDCWLGRCLDRIGATTLYERSPNHKSVKVAAIQLQCGHDIEENKTRTHERIRTLAVQGAEIVCLQELFSNRYFCQSECHDCFDFAEPIPGPITGRFGALAAELNIVIVTTVFEMRAAGIYHNSAVVLDTDGSVAGIYRKMHIPDDPFFYEKFYFTPGDLGFASFPTAKAKIGVCICWDQWFPEAARLTALSGAEIIVYPTAIGWLLDEKEDFGESQVDAWQTMMRSHAVANGVFVVAPNRVGLEDQIEFWGNSFIADPYGNVIGHAPCDRESEICVDCDLSLIETARTHWPFLRDRRIDAYEGLTRRYLDNA